MTVTLSPKQFADLLQVGSRTLRNYERDGMLPEPIIKTGKCTRWSRRAVERWIEGDGTGQSNEDGTTNIQERG